MPLEIGDLVTIEGGELVWRIEEVDQDCALLRCCDHNPAIDYEPSFWAEDLSRLRLWVDGS